MGKGAKTKNQEKRRKEKAARKSAMRSQYAKWAEDGMNTKSKRNTLRERKKRLYNSVSHPNGACGNIGCLRCSAFARDVKARMLGK